MISFLLIFLFIITKIFITYIIYNFFNLNSISIDYPIIIFYFLFSFINFIFYSINNIPKSKNFYTSSFIFRYNIIITILIDIITLFSILTYLYYLYQIEILLLLKLLLYLSLVYCLFFVIHNILFDKILEKSKIIVKKISVFPIILTYLIFFLYPLLFYYFEKQLVENISSNEIHYILYILLFNSLLILSLFIKKIIKLKNIVSYINDFEFERINLPIKINDPFDLCLLQSSLFNFNNKIKHKIKNLILINDNTSLNLKEKIIKNGINLEGEIHNATISCIKINLPYEKLSINDIIRLNNYIIRMINEYARDYDAYPFINLNNYFLFYGIPFDYNNKRLNALESAIKIAEDIEKLSEDEEKNITVYIGIYTGEVYTSAYPIYSNNYKSYFVTGKSIEYAQKIMEFATNLKENPIAVCDKTIENLKTRFYVAKVHKLKISDNQEINLNEIRFKFIKLNIK